MVEIQPSEPLTRETDQVPAREDWRLLLVNPWNPLPEDHAVELAALGNGHAVDARICHDLRQMMDDCRAAGLEPVICSSYRTQETQQRLYENKIRRLMDTGLPREEAAAQAGTVVAVPGTSEHQTGLALDIVDASYQVLDSAQASTAVQQWLMEHSWEYGFVLRYSGEEFDPDKVDVAFASAAGEIPVCRQGRGLDFDEDLAKRILTEDEVEIRVRMGEGDAACTCWGCDITYDYIKINGDYRT